jgi:hypothetical protein
MKCCLLMAVASLSIRSGAADAKDIPVEVHWVGAAPTQVLLSVPGGFQPLHRDPQRAIFRGQISIVQNNLQRRTLTVQYGYFSHPFDIRVHHNLARVAFSVTHQQQRSCTLARVQQASAPADNLPDAVNRSVAAGELLTIEEPNACDSNLRFGAARARFRQNVRMAELSNGFFMINPAVEEQYRREARQRLLSVEQEVAAYRQQDRLREARQLVAFRTAAEGVGNYDLAMDVTRLMAARIASDPDAAALYSQQGLTRSAVAAYMNDLSGTAAAIEAASPESSNDYPED